MTDDRQTLEEFDLGAIADRVGTATKGLASRIGNSVLAAFGSSSAETRVEIQSTVDHLYDAFMKWTAVHDRVPDDDALRQFMAAYDENAETDVDLSDDEPAADAPKPQSHDAPKDWAGSGTIDPAGFKAAMEAAGVDPATMRFALATVDQDGEPIDIARAYQTAKERMPAALKVALKDPRSYAPEPSAPSAANVEYANRAMSGIRDALYGTEPDLPRVARLTKELIAFAREHGGRDKQRVKFWLKALRRDPKVANNPALARLMQGMTLETVQRIVDGVIHLVENDIRDASVVRAHIASMALCEGVGQPLRASEIRRKLMPLALRLIRAGRVNFYKPEPSHKSAHRAASSSHGHYGRPVGAIDPTRLRRTLEYNHVTDQRLINYLVTYAERGYDASSLARAVEKEYGEKVGAEVFKSIIAANAPMSSRVGGH